MMEARRKIGLKEGGIDFAQVVGRRSGRAAERGPGKGDAGTTFADGDHDDTGVNSESPQNGQLDLRLKSFAPRAIKLIYFNSKD